MPDRRARARRGLAGDTISIGPGTFVETTSLFITIDLEIVGAGASVTALSVPVPPRALEVAVPKAKVEIRDLEIRDGSALGGDGAVRNAGTLILRNVHVRGNRAHRGGGIFNQPAAALWLYDSVVEGNESTGDGGGIFTDGTGVILMFDSVVAGNVAGSTSDGGGVAAWGNAFIIRSFIGDNGCGRRGGGIFSKAALQVVNSTIAANHAGENGGGLFATGKSVLTHVTVAHNAIPLDNPDVEDPGGAGNHRGGGVVAFHHGVVDLRNSIVAGNSADQCQTVHEQPFALTALVTGLGSLSSDNKCDLWPGWNLIGVDPLLGALDDHGGKTPTYALLAGSPAIDAASDKYWSGHDQRLFPRPVDGNGDGTARADIGAFERQSAEGGSKWSGWQKRANIWRRQGPKKPPPHGPQRIDR